MAEQMPLDFDAPPLVGEEMKVWESVRVYRGKGREIPGRIVSELTGIEYDRVREIIAHLVNSHHKLIGSNSHGYYVPVTAEEVAEVTRSLRHRGIMILVRAARLQKTSLVDIWNQTYLEFKEADHVR
jgi:hypothetical protein